MVTLPMLLHVLEVYILFENKKFEKMSTDFKSGAKNDGNKKAWYIHIISKTDKWNTLERHNMQLQQHEAYHVKSMAWKETEVKKLGTSFIELLMSLQIWVPILCYHYTTQKKA